jgi:hypothetical protein
LKKKCFERIFTQRTRELDILKEGYYARMNTVQPATTVNQATIEAATQRVEESVKSMLEPIVAQVLEKGVKFTNEQMQEQLKEVIGSLQPTVQVINKITEWLEHGGGGPRNA